MGFTATALVCFPPSKTVLSGVNRSTVFGIFGGEQFFGNCISTSNLQRKKLDLKRVKKFHRATQFEPLPSPK